MSAHWLTSRERACWNEPFDTFITSGDADDEPPYPSLRARSLCSICPVRVDCLRYALEQDIEFGVWGGLSAFQRSQIKRKQSRKTCPGCGYRDGIVEENGYEVCLGCGVTWPIW